MHIGENLYNTRNLHGDLDRALECLVHPHTQDITDLETGTRTVTVQALLTRLRLIVANGPGTPKGSGGGNQASKDNAFYPAVDLIGLILKTAIREAARLSGAPARIGITAEDAITALVTEAKRHDYDTQLEILNLLESWGREIITMTEPPNILEIRAACPKCGTRTVTEKTVHGEERPTAALVIISSHNQMPYGLCKAKDCPKGIWLYEELKTLRKDLDAADNTERKAA